MSDESLPPAHVLGALEREQDAARAVEAAAPQVAMAREHLESLFRSMQPFPDGAHIAITWPEPNSTEVQPKMISRHFAITALEDASEFAVGLDAYRKRNVYLTMCPHLDDLGPRRRGTTSEAIASPGAWHDLDIHNPSKAVHAATNLPPTAEVGLALIAEAGLPPPSRIVRSGHGLYPLWLFSDGVWIFANDEEREIAHAVVKGIQRRIIDAAATHGWHQDTTSDLARVLRIPGTHNRKVNREPIPVETVERGARYSRDELLRFADIERSTRVSVPASHDESSEAVVPGAWPRQHRSSTGDGPTRADEIATGEPCPRPIIERDLRNLLNLDLRAAAVLMLDGKPFAARGKRDAMMFKLASALARIAPFNPPDDLLDVMRLSLAAIASEPGARLTLEEEEAKARDKLIRAQRDALKRIAKVPAAAATTDESLGDDEEPSEASDNPRERVLARLEEPRPSYSIAEAQAVIRDAIAKADSGSLMIIRAECGSGKTYAVEQEAIRRARNNQLTAILFPTHNIARETVERLRAARVPVKYRMSPHAMIDPSTGKPFCKYPQGASLVAAASMGVRREMCLGLGEKNSRCPHVDVCPAASGADTDDNPLVYVAPHQLVDEAVEFVGAQGLLVLDEPPELVTALGVEAEALEAMKYAIAVLYGDTVLRTLADAMDLGIRVAAFNEDALEVLRRGLGEIERSTRGNRLPLVWRGLGRNEPLDAQVLRQLSEAVRDDGSPQLSTRGLREMREGRATQTFSRGVQVLSAIARCLLDASGAGRSWIPPQSGVVNGKLWIIEHSNTLIPALSSMVPTVLLDATSNIKKLSPFVMKTPRVVTVPVADGAEIERVCVASSNANRKGWIPNGQFKADKFVGPFRRALEIVCEDPERRVLGIVAYKKIEPILETGWRGDRSTLGSDERKIAETFDVWRARGGEVRFLHFGGERGRNDLADVDALIALGDPWPRKVESAAATAAVLDLDFEETYLADCRAALTQAVGRLRAPRRTKRAIVVVVGTVPPAGWTRENTRVEGLRRGARSKWPPGIRGDVLRVWRESLDPPVSRRELAVLLGLDEGTLRTHGA